MVSLDFPDFLKKKKKKKAKFYRYLSQAIQLSGFFPLLEKCDAVELFNYVTHSENDTLLWYFAIYANKIAIAVVLSCVI